jgi:hypothetical protein
VDGVQRARLLAGTAVRVWRSWICQTGVCRI